MGATMRSMRPRPACRD